MKKNPAENPAQNPAHNTGHSSKKKGPFQVPEQDGWDSTEKDHFSQYCRQDFPQDSWQNFW